MAASSSNTIITNHILLLLIIIITTFSSLHISSVSSFEYQVGGNKAWSVPPSNDSNTYNHWASDNRFLVGDTLRFEYRKDSVMEVSAGDYKNCNSSHPSFFSNTGNTLYKLEHPGAFYFISGAYGHCDKGQKMIVKVISDGGDGEENSSSQEKSAASLSAVSCLGVCWAALLQLVLSFVVVSCVFHH